MRRLLLTRGPQGAGKSTILAELDLLWHRLSADDLRLTLASPVLGREGRIGIPQSQDKRVWRMLLDILDERMARGELLVVDATHPSARSFADYRKLARKHRYRLACLDLSTVPLDDVLARNAARDPLRVVPEEVVRRTAEACRFGVVPPEILRIPWASDGSHLASLRAWLDEPIEDFSAWTRVHHIGDLQGCLQPLLDWLGPEGVRSDELYLFVGDLCDRGDENGEVMRWVLEQGMGENVRIHWGNHEDHLHRWATGQAPVSDEFIRHTLPQLVAAGIRPSDAERVCARIVEATRYRWHRHQVLVTHAGLSTVPDRPERVSTWQYSHGTGWYSDPVGDQFDGAAPEGWVQVHGHRNHGHRPVRASSRSFNLEDAVEYGGHLRVVTLDAGGWHPRELRNRRHRPFTQRLGDRIVPFSKILPAWVTPDLPSPSLGMEGLAALRDHDLVAEKPAGSRPWISAFNFTRDAFFNAAWDDLTIRARGLFVNTDTGEIVARSYDKFFNVGERPETTWEALAANLEFPVTLYVKENGYLGILGYDAVQDDLFWASKTTPDSEFAGWFRDLAEVRLDPSAREQLRRFLRDTQSSFVFEVIDPVRDPHIIAYDQPRLVLLDVVRRAGEFQAMEYGRLVEVGARFGLEVKERAMVFRELAGLEGWLKVAESPDYRFRGQPVEGFVLEDAGGFLTKLKLSYYAFWKRMRSLKERVRKVRGTSKPLQRDISDPEVHAFYLWLLEQSDALLEADLVTVREAWETQRVPDHLLAAAEAGESPRDPEGERFRGMLRSLEDKHSGYVLKAETADQLLALALQDDRRLKALGASPLRVAVVVAATAGDERTEAADRLGVDVD